MKKKKPEEVVVEAVNDLFIRDIEKLLFDVSRFKTWTKSRTINN